MLTRSRLFLSDFGLGHRTSTRAKDSALSAYLSVGRRPLDPSAWFLDVYDLHEHFVWERSQRYYPMVDTIRVFV